jgi:hypothetical protein
MAQYRYPLQKHVRMYMQLQATCVFKFVAAEPRKLHVKFDVNNLARYDLQVRPKKCDIHAQQVYCL